MTDEQIDAIAAPFMGKNTFGYPYFTGYHEHLRRFARAIIAASASAQPVELDDAARTVELLRWAYSKLVYRSFDNMDDALAMDEIKLLLTHPA